VQLLNPRFVFISFAGLLALGWPCAAADTYVRVDLNGTGQLQIVTKQGRTILLDKKPDQVGFAALEISENGRAVGWLAMYSLCCTSYPRAQKLMIYSSGRLREVDAVGPLPFDFWHFMDGGRRFAFETNTLHGPALAHYELRDVATGRILAGFDPPWSPDGQTLLMENAPRWVKELEAKRQKTVSN
jgi:hypothetical protein